MHYNLSLNLLPVLSPPTSALITSIASFAFLFCLFNINCFFFSFFFSLTFSSLRLAKISPRSFFHHRHYLPLRSINYPPPLPSTLFPASLFILFFSVVYNTLDTTYLLYFLFLFSFLFLFVFRSVFSFLTILLLLLQTNSRVCRRVSCE